MAIDQIDNAAVKLHTQPWTIVAVLIGVSIVLIGICVCCIRRCCRKRRGKDGKKGIKGVDLKSVQLLGSAYKEKVRVTYQKSFTGRFIVSIVHVGSRLGATRYGRID